MMPATPFSRLFSAEARASAQNPAEGIVWDLTTYFPGLDSPEYQSTRRAQTAIWAELLAELEALSAGTPGLVDILEHLLLKTENAMVDYSHLMSYIGCLGAADSTSQTINRERGQLATTEAEVEKVFALLGQRLAGLSAEQLAELLARPSLEGATLAIDRMALRGRYSMPPAEEMLAADLAVDGFSAWGRLYDQISGSLTFDMTMPDGTSQRLPMSQRSALLEHPDPRVRRTALEASNQAWTSVQDPVAACLNHIAGSRLTLQKRRGFAHFLDEALIDKNLERTTLEAMWQAVASSREVPWRFLWLKGRALGMERLGFQDVHAPLPEPDAAAHDEPTIAWRDALALLDDAIRPMYPAFADFCAELVASRRFEAEKRPGKRLGAFCTSSLRTRLSHIFMTYGGSLNDVLTMAHELGHAWHSHLLRDVRPFAENYPMTLAESASTFAEAIVCNHLLHSPATPARLRRAILNQRLSDMVVYLLNIHMRYLFECRFMEERQQGPVTIDRLRELITTAQMECFGEGLDPQQLDPMFWASKLHFYITGTSFYNFPYTFGYLFSQALILRFQQQGEAFLPVYEAFLRQSGSAMCEDVAKNTLGADLGSPDFWRAPILAAETDLKLFEEVALPRP